MAAIGCRPNIRIEIQNNLAEPMDIDGEEKPVDSDFEDGEISDKNDPSAGESQIAMKPTNNRMWTSTDGGFTTGVDIFDKKEQEKLQERANRFGLKPDEINNFTDEHLQKLHVSLGITMDNEKNVRFEAVHMRGTDEMSTEDVFEYFEKYGPAYIEWINDESCNVVWQDKVSAARALHFISKPVRGMPVEGPCDPFVKEVVLDSEADTNTEKEESGTGRSILLINKDREVQLEKEEAEIVSTNENEKYDENSVDVSTITIPIPPGYWRLGIQHPKTKFVLLRFAFKTDKKPLRAERFSEYYKKYGNPNFGGMKGLISESRRKKFKGIFDRNKEIMKKTVEDSKNPWGDLAENWDADAQFCEKVYEPKVILNSPPKRDVTNYSSEKSDVLKRLGAKRNHETDNESTGSSQENLKKKSKIPRMRMYADEEEEKIKRKKQLLEVKLHHKSKQDDTNKIQDLRNIIGTAAKKVERPEHRELLIDSSDLGTKLKNRSRNEDESKRHNHKSDAARISRGEVLRTRHNSDRRSDTTQHRSLLGEERCSRQKQEFSSHRRSSRHGYDRSQYKNRLHSDRYERQRHSLSDDDVTDGKPKSKVTVVIKTQKRPVVASTIWSRITPKKERLKTASERLQGRRDSSSSTESSSASNSSTSSSSESSSSDSSSESEEESNDENDQAHPPDQVVVKAIERPGFRSNVQPSAALTKRKSPLRIEISNDHFKEE